MEAKKKGWNIVCEDESIVVYDSVVRAVWAKKGSKPTILTTGSHVRTCLFGALSMDKGQLFRQYDWVDGRRFLKFLKVMKSKFDNMLLFIDKSNPHRKEEEVRRWLKENKSCIKVVWFPTGCPEFNPLEECWKQTKDSVVACVIHQSFTEMKKLLAKYLRTKRFKLDIVKYLCR